MHKEFLEQSGDDSQQSSGSDRHDDSAADDVIFGGGTTGVRVETGRAALADLGVDSHGQSAVKGLVEVSQARKNVSLRERAQSSRQALRSAAISAATDDALSGLDRLSDGVAGADIRLRFEAQVHEVLLARREVVITAVEADVQLSGDELSRERTADFGERQARKQTVQVE